MIEDKCTNAQQQLIMVTKNSMANEMVFAILNHLHTLRSIDKSEGKQFFFLSFSFIPIAVFNLNLAQPIGQRFVETIRIC